MRDREVPPATLEGWYVLHQLFRLGRPGVRALSPADRTRAGEEVATLLGEWSEPDDDGWTGCYRLVGGGADFLFLHFRSSLERLSAAERRIQRTALADHLGLALDYLSVVELGLYGVTVDVARRLEAEDRGDDPDAWDEALAAALEEQRAIPYVQGRLRPVQPDDMPYVCFYPMNKRRRPGQNWYTLPLEERSRMMHDHGAVGRRYALRISQVISGSVGLDDWEWGVTLFARDPLDFKNVVTEMRYDRASAEYADFGDFYVGFRMAPREWTDPESW